MPEGQDIIVKIAKAGMEEVKNPTKRGDAQKKKVLRFEGDYKPFIVNMVNSAMVKKITGKRYVEDTVGCMIQLYVATEKIKGEQMDCLRIRPKAPKPKENLTPAHAKWDGAIGKIQEGKSVDYLRQWYDISKENETLLLKSKNA